MSQPSTRTGKHHKALYVLFLTEMWERFAYYLLAGVLLIYLIDTRLKGGKGMNASDAADLTGTFIALIWLPPFIGGLIADRYLGYIKSIFIGGALLALGYLGLTLPGDTTMYISLGLIIVGNGFFKPNVSTLLGTIYNRDDLKPLKDNAYNIFYMGINTGALLCNFAAAFLRNKYGWRAAFAAAGIGMIISLITFGLNLSKVREGNVLKPAQPEDMPLSKISLYVFLPAIIAAIIGYKVPTLLFHTTLMGKPSNDAFVFACIPVIGYFVSIWTKAKGDDKKGIGALLFIFAASVIFWSLYYQNFTAYSLWAQQHTDRTLSSPAISKTANFMDLQETVSTAPRATDSVDAHLMPVTDAKGQIIKTTGPDPYYNNVPREQWPAPDQPQKLANAELFQSIGPFFIVTLTPLLLLLFGWLRKRKMEPTTPGKFGLALFISGLSSLWMVWAVMSVPSIYQYKVSPAWLWGTYFLVTIAEVFLSPMGLSLVSKLAPPRLTSLLMGGWFLTMSLGGKFAGLMTSSWDKFTDKKVFFLIWFVAGTVGSILIFSRIKSLNRIVREKTGEA